MKVTVVDVTCTCVVPGCGWVAQGFTGTQEEAAKLGRALIADHLREKHGIVHPRIQTMPTEQQ